MAGKTGMKQINKRTENMRNYFVSVRFTQDERQEIESVAGSLNLSKSSFIRKVLLKYMEVFK